MKIAASLQPESLIQIPTRAPTVAVPRPLPPRQPLRPIPVQRVPRAVRIPLPDFNAAHVKTRRARQAAILVGVTRRPPPVLLIPINTIKIPTAFIVRKPSVEERPPIFLVGKIPPQAPAVMRNT